MHVRATDNATNTETGPSRTFTYDTTPPETTIDSNPSDPSTSSGATFTFSADEGGSTFECELDGAGFSSCSSPKSYSSLSDGSHTFKVKATDGAGNTDPTPAQYTWTVDTTAPSSATTFPASGAAYNASGWNAGCGTVGFCGTYSDATTGVQKVEISIRRGAGNYWNGSGFSSGSEVWNIAGLSGGNWSYAFATTDFPADGSYTIRVKATDNAGNGETPASRSFTYDTADPSALFSFPASGGDYTNAAWNAGCGTAGFCGTYSDATSGVQAVEISIRRGTGNYWNGTSFGSASEVFQTASLSAGNWSYAFVCVELPGRRRLHRARARDGQRVEHRVGPEPDLPDRQREPERALLLPGLWEAPTRTPAGMRAAARTASAARTPTRPPASRPSTSPSSASAPASTGTAARSRPAPRTSRRRASRAATGHTPSPHRASRPTGATPFISARTTTPATRRPARAVASRSTASPRTRPSTRARQTRPHRPTRPSPSPRPRVDRPSSASSTAAASPPARARRATRACPTAATRSRCAPSMQPGIRTPLRRSRPGRSTPSRRARR